MPDSKRVIFAWGAIGNVAPLLLKWLGQERITMPGDAFGGLLAVLLFAVFAGGVVAFVWKERTVARAFWVGLALPYILWGALADMQDMRRVKRARAQEEQTSRQDQVRLSGSLGWSVVKLDVMGEDGKKLTMATATATNADNATIVRVENPDEIVLQPGKYRLKVWSPGYKPRELDVNVGGAEVKPLTVQL